MFILLISLLILFTLLLRLPSLPEPLGNDQACFAYVGTRILQGAVPYRDVWGNNPPGIFYLYSLILAVFGRTAFAVRLADLLCSVAVMIMIFVLSRRMFGEKIAFIAAFIYGLFSANYYAVGGWWANGQSESFMMLPIIGGIYCLVISKDKSDLWLFVTGVLFGLAFLIKTVAGFVFAGLLLFFGRVFGEG
ncbi:MAG: glycosyltransferase family 39 protein [Actinomycetota bacterium]|nr:glycosyltransferase family 39 protein [Actinomycetota bacterium]